MNQKSASKNKLKLKFRNSCKEIYTIINNLRCDSILILEVQFLMPLSLVLGQTARYPRRRTSQLKKCIALQEGAGFSLWFLDWQTNFAAELSTRIRQWTEPCCEERLVMNTSKDSVQSQLLWEKQESQLPKNWEL